MRLICSMSLKMKSLVNKDRYAFELSCFTSHVLHFPPSLIYSEFDALEAIEQREPGYHAKFSSLHPHPRTAL